MVGMESFSVMSARKLPGNGLQDDGKSARCLQGERVVHDLARRVEGLALDLEPAEHARGLRRQPDMAEHGNARLHDGVHRGGHLLAALQLHRVAPAVLVEDARRS